MHKRYELTGKVFGRLTVIAFDSVGKDYATKWLVRCECGSEKIVVGKNLIAGRTQSCGCKQGGRSEWHEAAFAEGKGGAVYRSHGMTETPLYVTWTNIKGRCYNPNNADYRIYGGRGIKVCEHWRADFEAFYRDMSPTWQPGLTIDRIDSNGNYEPGNCRWVPMSEQWKNRRSHGRKRAADGSSQRTKPPDLEER